MTGVEVIVAALAAGTAAGGRDAAKTTVFDVYTGLRGMLRRWLAGHDRAEQYLDAHEIDPEVWQTRLGQDLTDTGADRDEQILAAAHQLLALVDPAGANASKYTVDMRGAQQPQTGDNTVRIGTNYGPIAGTMTGPVTVTYGEQPPVPPAAPEA